MRVKGIKSFISIILSAVIALSVLMMPIPAKADVDVEKWTQDINQMREIVNPIYFSGRGKIAITSDDFKKSCDEIIKKLPNLSETQVALEITKTIAMLGDGHATPLYSNFKYYPMYLYWLDDGPYLVQTTAEYSSVLNMRLAKVGGMPFDQALALIEPYISHDTQYWVRHVVWNYIANAALLKYVGIAKADDSCDFTFADDEGNEKTVTAKSITIDRNTKWVIDPGYERIVRDDPPLCFQGRYYYFYKYLPNSGLMYVNYKKCMESRDYTFASFMSELKREWKSSQPSKLVLDIRFNSGGSTLILKPFLDWVKDNPDINRPDKFFVITGRRTFSAASQNAAQLYTQTKATFVGEPIGQKPNHWGEARSYVLNNSKMGLYLSSRYMVMMSDSDPDTIAPDFEVAWNHKDYFKGIDTVLDTITSGKLPPNQRIIERTPESIEDWTNDLQQIKVETMLKLTEFSKYSKPQNFIDQIDELIAKVPKMNDLDISFELAKVMKTFKNPNFTIANQYLSSRTYVLGFIHVGDGVYVNMSTKSNKDVAGKKIVAIAGLSKDELAKKFSEYFYFTDFDQFFIDYHLLLFNPDVLYKLGIITDKTKLVVTCEDVDGKKQDISLVPTSVEESMQRFVILPDYTITPKPFYKKPYTGQMWDYFISDKKALYVNMLDAGIGDPEQGFEDFKKSVQSQDVKTIVFDYRFTISFETGFRSSCVPFYEKLAKFIGENKGKFKFYAILDKMTPENGVYDCAYLRKRCDITIVGETPVIKPTNIYSYMTSRTSLLEISVRIPSKRFSVEGYSEGESLVPDKEIINLGKFYFNGIDPVMDWILAQ